jgi:hypothetical protein
MRSGNPSLSAQRLETAPPVGPGLLGNLGNISRAYNTTQAYANVRFSKFVKKADGIRRRASSPTPRRPRPRQADYPNKSSSSTSRTPSSRNGPPCWRKMLPPRCIRPSVTSSAPLVLRGTTVRKRNSTSWTQCSTKLDFCPCGTRSAKGSPHSASSWDTPTRLLALPSGLIDAF